MDDFLILPLIHYLHSLGGEALSIITFGVGVMMMMLMFCIFGLMGLYVYGSVSVLIANIQVLKLMTMNLFPDPVALGTATFCTVFLANDIITEHYGKEAAKKSIWLSFITQILVTLSMIIAIGFKPVDGDEAHNAISMLFMPSLRLLTASLIAFVISQLVNINIFQFLSNLCKEKQLWLRSNVALMSSEFIDNVIFSSLAWVILASNPVSTSSLIYTYILGTYFLRVFFAIFSTPVIYCSYYFKPEGK